MDLFGKKKTPEEMTREWIHNLKHEQRQVERSIKKADQEIVKLKNEMKKEAKNAQGDLKRMQAVKILARTIVQSNKQITHLYGVKGQINSVILHIKEQNANNKMMKTMQRSAQITSLMGRLIKLPELQATAHKMSMEMQKAGLMSEMVDEAFDQLDDPDMEDDVDAEIDKVVMEVTNLRLNQIGDIKNKNLNKQEELEDKTDDKDLDAMRQRLKALS